MKAFICIQMDLAVIMGIFNMKKFCLVFIMLFLIVGEVKANDTSYWDIRENVDLFYDKCIRELNVPNLQNQSYTTVDALEIGICYGFVAGVSEIFLNNRVSKKNVSIKCNLSFGNIFNRFKVLYNRNQFEIGQDAVSGISQTINSLCPFISEEQFIKEWGFDMKN